MRPLMCKEFAVSDGKTEQICGNSENEDDVKKSKKRTLGADKEMMLAFLSSNEFKPSRLRPRKNMPALAMESQVSKTKLFKRPALEEVDFKMVDLGDEAGPDIIGRRVEVFWPDSRRWFRGRVKAFDHQKLVHKIDYDDGDIEHLHLKNEVFRMEVYPGESVVLKPEFNIKNKQKLSIAKETGEQQKGQGLEKVTDISTHDSCSGVPINMSGHTLCFGQLSCQVEMAVNVNNSCALTGKLAVETRPELENNS